MPRPLPDITVKDVKRAVYIDFEGYPYATPTLLGVLIEEEFDQFVFDKILHKAAIAEQLRTESLEEIIDWLFDVCTSEKRYLVAFTQHERNQIKRYCDRDVEPFYLDAHKLAKRWKNSLHYEENIDSWSLKDFLRFIDYPRDEALGEGTAAQRIKTVKDALSGGATYASLDQVIKDDWGMLLEYNYVDCDGMRDLVLHTTRERIAAKKVASKAPKKPG
jgi:hypothetical protein